MCTNDNSYQLFYEYTVTTNDGNTIDYSPHCIVYGNWLYVPIAFGFVSFLANAISLMYAIYQYKASEKSIRLSQAYWHLAKQIASWIMIFSLMYIANNIYLFTRVVSNSSQTD